MRATTPSARSATLSLGLLTGMGLFMPFLQAQQVYRNEWPYMLMYPIVQQELGLEKPDMERIGSLLGQPEERRPKGEALERGATELLNPKQRTRLEQMRHQVLLTRGVLAPKLVETLGLSADQRDKMKQVIAENNAQHDILLKRLMTENLRLPGARDKLKKKYFEPARQRVLAVLTDEQRVELNRQLGQDFEGAFQLAESL